jgi:NAD(P)-dependent dehydrogenase (short-subunit alcohol dehydrogenase family)
MITSLAGKVAIVTGAGSGLGKAHANLLAERGAHVVVQELLPERAESVAAGIRSAGGKAESLGGDASDVAGMRAAVAAIEDRLGHIDILVNNAGISGRGAAFESIDEEGFDRMIAVHVKSAFFFAQFVVPGMKARRYGRIVNTSSMFAMKGSPNMAHYTVAKGALLGLTKALALELAPWNITVNAIAPGLVKTDMTSVSFGHDDGEFDRRAALVPMRRLAEASDVARLVAFLVSDDAALVTGQTVSPSGGDAMPAG